MKKFWVGSLNRKVWRDDVLIPEVKDRLVVIAKEFYDDLGLRFNIVDVTLVGSLANFNWHDNSDFDVHIYTDADPKNLESVHLKRLLWNMRHNITIRGYVVEMYVMAQDEVTESAGEYSLITNSWISEPVDQVPVIDLDLVEKKVGDYIEEINLMQNELEKSEYGLSASGIRARAILLRDRLLDNRRTALMEAGEFETDNLVYKQLRSEGYISRLYDLIDDGFDKMWSME